MLGSSLWTIPTSLNRSGRGMGVAPCIATRSDNGVMLMFLRNEQGALIADRLMSLESVQKCTGVSVYLSMPSKEVPTYPILDRLFAAMPPKSVFVPKVCHV